MSSPNGASRPQAGVRHDAVRLFIPVSASSLPMAVISGDCWGQIGISSLTTTGFSILFRQIPAAVQACLPLLHVCRTAGWPAGFVDDGRDAVSSRIIIRRSLQWNIKLVKGRPLDAPAERVPSSITPREAQLRPTRGPCLCPSEPCSATSDHAGPDAVTGYRILTMFN